MRHLYQQLPFLLFGFCAFTSTAQPPFTHLKFITYTTENGLADNYVVKTIADRKGFLWIATRNGLSRFDGLVFTNYAVDNPAGNGLRSSWITDLALDNQGTLWVSTEWGLCYYNEATGRFCYINNRDELVVLYRAPLHVNGEVLWMACESGLLKINTRTKTLSSTSLKKISDPQSICTDAKGVIWIGTRGHGLFSYEPSKDKWTEAKPTAVLPTAHFMSFYKDSEDLWIATNQGLLQLPAKGQPVLYTDVKGNVNTVADELMFATQFPPIAGDSVFICGTYNKRIALFNKRKKKFSAVFSGSDAQLYGIPNTIFNDGQYSGNNLWLGTDKGLTMLNMQAQDFTTYFLEGLGKNWSKSIIRKIAPFAHNVNKVLFLLNNPGSLALYDRQTNKVEKLWTNPQAVRNYNSILTDTYQNRWLIHESGIDRFTPERGIWPVYSSVNQMFFSGRFDDEGLLWIGTGDGLLCFNTFTNKARYFSAAFNGTAVENTSFPFSFFANDVCPDNRNHIWIASTKYGLFCFDKSTQKFTAYRQPSSAAYETKNRCSGLLFDGDGKLWISTLAGLSCFDTAAKTFVNYGVAQGLLSSYVYAMEGNGIGLITGRGNSGVFLFNTQTKKFVNHTVPIPMSTELLRQQVSIVNGDFSVGFQGGFSVYPATQQKQVAADLPVFITDCVVGSKRHSTNDSLNLDYRQNNLQISYAAVSYTQPNQTRYRYQLSGSDWTDAGTNRSVSYTALPPGHYQFTVMAIDVDGRQCGAPAVLNFVIHPPFWKTVWFRLCLVLLLAGITAFAFSHRIKQIKKREAQKTAANKAVAEIEMKALRSQMNPHFIFNSLNSIQKYIWEARQEDAAEYLTKFARLIRFILENSAHKLVPLQKEMASLKLYLELEHRRSNQKFDYSISVDEAMDTQVVMIPPLLLQPYIENAIWHGLNPKKSRGELILSIQQKENTIVCTIDDNGIGRHASQQNKSGEPHTPMGLNISLQRVQLMREESGIEATVLVTDKTDVVVPMGTTVQIILPLILHHA